MYRVCIDCVRLVPLSSLWKGGPGGGDTMGGVGGRGGGLDHIHTEGWIVIHDS